VNSAILACRQDEMLTHLNYRLLHKSLNFLVAITSKNHNTGLITHNYLRAALCKRELQWLVKVARAFSPRKPAIGGLPFQDAQRQNRPHQKSRVTTYLIL
jgi:hypothetical protein